jgi:hypothetical protein
MKGKNKRGAEVAKGLVVADTHGQEIFRGIVAYKVVKEKGSIQRGDACFEG